MGRFGNSRRRTALPTTHGSAGRPRGDGRLDPVRWRRPGGGTLIRLAAVAALLATAAAVLWSPNSPGSSCGPADAVRSSPPRPSGALPAADGPAAGGASATIGATGSGASTPVPEGSVGVPIRLADPTALGLVRPGNRVDLLRVDDQGGSSTPIAGAALVLRVTGADDPAAGGLLLALTPEQARQAVIAPRQGFAVVIRSG